MRFFLLFCLVLSLYARDFKVATYNVENLFDLQNNGHEYPEYIPNKHNWNATTFEKKIANIARVIKDLNADVIGLEEVENQNVLNLLNNALGEEKYPYVFISKDASNVQTALLSRLKILSFQSLHVKDFPRSIWKIVLQIEGKEFVVYLNHWPSVHYPNTLRIAFAKALLADIKDEKREYIILGDFNAPFMLGKKQWGESLEGLKQEAHSLWLEIPLKQRYSHMFFHDKKALDQIFISFSFFDGKDIEYKPQSFGVFSPAYLFDTNGNVNRWQISDKGKGKHLGKGFSDHLPLSAVFQTDNYKKLTNKCSTITELKQYRDGKVDILLCNVQVEEKNKYGFFLKDRFGERVYVYKPDFWLEKEKVYDLHVEFLGTYKGKKEITLLKKVQK